MNGRVIPVTGMIPIAMAMFSKIWKENMDRIPITIREPYKSLALSAIFSIL
jgi:hypothetical protein